MPLSPEPFGAPANLDVIAERRRPCCSDMAHGTGCAAEELISSEVDQVTASVAAAASASGWRERCEAMLRADEALVAPLGPSTSEHLARLQRRWDQSLAGPADPRVLPSGRVYPCRRRDPCEASAGRPAKPLPHREGRLAVESSIPWRMLQPQHTPRPFPGQSSARARLGDR
mmetsp:Transcript_174731/g.560432  ORF Transcript_174731/g.560432 Transcript_174731/m.560432 type:complete len:172 (+) Transcript_174731:99-614(+)|eukprot:CAMPEP_0204128092 /NCGR_PEP_ID=MMETSP0361-20130328/11976_1 /ASSEMBLY_ACC=CAM_ASM_000343 /TAXON_ID=268821 /ORGANISM="Scrippsiella Hangoei, Strain SHTV-5" /LENGTH=171 /DNA_ID=CAMNT_0051080255 /DNA_START=103 /DNA_END=618 /DNA_ORIENTATION=-